MLGKIRRILDSQRGFTLVELMTVLIILGVILAIGVPKYLKIQAKSEWDADVITIENIAKAAEVYAAQKNKTGNISLKTDLIDNEIIDGEIALNRVASGTLSEKNTSGKKLKTYTTIDFAINADSGQVTNLWGTGNIIEKMIGNSPY